MKNDTIGKMNNKMPICRTKSEKEKGHYGKPHLVLLRYENHNQVQLAILIPYRETYKDEDDNKKTWLSWSDIHGNVYLPIDDLLARKWIPLDDVSPEFLKALDITPPSEQEWKQVMT